MKIQKIEQFKKQIFENREHVDYPKLKKNVYLTIQEAPGITVREIEKKTSYNPYSIWDAIVDLRKEGLVKTEGGESRHESYRHYSMEDFHENKQEYINKELNRKVIECLESDNKGCTIQDIMSYTEYSETQVRHSVEMLIKTGRIEEKNGMFYSADYKKPRTRTEE